MSDLMIDHSVCDMILLPLQIVTSLLLRPLAIETCLLLTLHMFSSKHCFIVFRSLY